MKYIFRAVVFYYLLVQSFQIFSQEDAKTSQEMYTIITENTRLNPQKSIFYSQKLLAHSKEHNSLDSIAIAYMYLGKAGRVQGTYEKAIEYTDLGIMFAEMNHISKSILAELYLTKANNLADLGKGKESAKIMFKGVEIAKETGDLKTKVILNHGLGYIYKSSGNIKKAKATLRNNINLIEENRLTDKKSFEAYYKGMAMLSFIYLDEQSKDSARFYMKEGLKHVLKTTDIFTKMAFYEGLSILFLKEKNYEKTLENLQKNRELGNSIGNTFINSENDFGFAEYYYETKNYQKSIDELSSIVTFYNSKKDVYINSNVYKLLAKNYQKLGNLSKANENYELYVLNYQNAQNDSRDLYNVVQDKELLDLVIEKENQKKTTLFLVLGGGLLIAVLTFYVFYISVKRKKETIKFKELLIKIEATKEEKKSEIVDTKDLVLEDKSASDINPEIYEQIIQGLEKIVDQNYFLKKECSSYTIAKKIKTNTSYLSKVINLHYQKNFNTYINDLRINYSVLKLKEDSRFRSYSVKSISEEIGYKSPVSFTKYFKKRTGLLPSVYIKKLNTTA